jgi:hypothetical protein
MYFLSRTIEETYFPFALVRADISALMAISRSVGMDRRVGYAVKLPIGLQPCESIAAIAP